MVVYVERALERLESAEIDQTYKIEDKTLNSFCFLSTVMLAEVHLDDIISTSHKIIVFWIA